MQLGGANKERQKGYTLLEIALVLSIIGLLVASFVGAYSVYIKNKTMQTTANNAGLVINALGNFLIQQGRYPCPAPIDVNRTDPRYGIEDCTGMAAVAIGTCANGFCTEESERTVDIDPDPLVTNMITPRVTRGAVPFRTLALAEHYSEDGHGQRYSYAVTEILTDATTFMKDGGGVSLVDGQTPPRSILNVVGSAHYVVFGSGPDRAGSYSRFGAQHSPCPTGTLDEENCNTSSTNIKAVYRYAENSTAQGVTHFDDFIKFYSTVETPLWKVADAGGFDIRDLIDAGPGGGVVGIGIDTPTQTVEVAGNVLGDEVYASELCGADPLDPNGTDCFDVNSIGGSDPNMDCTDPAHPQYSVVTPKPYVVATGSRQVTCSDKVDLKCPVGQYMTGVSVAGNLICAPFSGCPSRVSPLCLISGVQDTFTIPPGTQGQTISSHVSGASFQRHFVCNNGFWSLVNTTGSCTCNPINANFTPTCNQWHNNGNWTGNVTYNRVTVCPSGTTTNTVLSQNCVCAPATYTQTRNCPAGYTGGPQIWTQDWTCSSSTTGSYTPWVIQTNPCVCNPQTNTQTQSCPVGYTGTGIIQQQDFQCPAGTWTGWYTVSNNCTCTGATQTQTIGCPNGQLGNIDQERYFDCNTGQWGPWVTVSSQCAAVVYIWKPKTTPNGPFPSALPIEQGDICNTQGATASCSTPSNGGHWHYASCECE